MSTSALQSSLIVQNVRHRQYMKVIKDVPAEKVREIEGKMSDLGGKISLLSECQVYPQDAWSIKKLKEQILSSSKELSNLLDQTTKEVKQAKFLAVVLAELRMPLHPRRNLTCMERVSGLGTQAFKFLIVPAVAYAGYHLANNFFSDQ